MPTPLYGLPLYGDDDTAELDVLLNGQSTAIETALSTQFVDRNGMSVPNFASLPTGGNWQGRALTTRATGLWYVRAGARVQGGGGSWLTASTSLPAAAGAIDSGQAAPKYKYVEGAVVDSVTVTISNAGTGGGGLSVEMPFTVAGTWMGVGRSEIDGSQLQVRVQGSSATVFKYNNNTPIANGTLFFTVTCGLS